MRVKLTFFSMVRILHAGLRARLTTGNRSPLADPKMRGMMSGLTLDDHLTDLAAKFNVTLEVCF